MSMSTARNVAIIIALAVGVWKLPGGGTASNTIANLFSVLFTAGLFFLGYGLYMEHRTTAASSASATGAGAGSSAGATSTGTSSSTGSAAKR